MPFLVVLHLIEHFYLCKKDITTHWTTCTKQLLSPYFNVNFNKIPQNQLPPKSRCHMQVLRSLWGGGSIILWFVVYRYCVKNFLHWYILGGFRETSFALNLRNNP